MKTNTLRIGNIVLVNGKPIAVEAVHKRKVAYHGRPDTLSWARPDELQGVPLRFDVLVAMGFVLTNSLGDGLRDQIIVGHDLCFQYEERDGHVVLYATLGNREVTLTSVHEVQNIMTDFGLKERKFNLVELLNKIMK